MAYIVQTDGPADHTAASVILDDREGALATAVKWASEGRVVKILGNGKIYTPEDLAVAIINNE